MLLNSIVSVLACCPLPVFVPSPSCDCSNGSGSGSPILVTPGLNPCPGGLSNLYSYPSLLCPLDRDWETS